MQQEAAATSLTSFNSLQTGKHMGTRLKRKNNKRVKKVSIPYKRESTWELSVNQRQASVEGHVFQFPTNGKAHGNQPYFAYRRVPTLGFNSLQTGKHMGTFCEHTKLPAVTPVHVSIPYKRESTWELRIKSIKGKES